MFTAHFGPPKTSCKSDTAGACCETLATKARLIKHGKTTIFEHPMYASWVNFKAFQEISCLFRWFSRAKTNAPTAVMDAVTIKTRSYPAKYHSSDPTTGADASASK